MDDADYETVGNNATDCDADDSFEELENIKSGYLCKHCNYVECDETPDLVHLKSHMQTTEHLLAKQNGTSPPSKLHELSRDFKNRGDTNILYIKTNIEPPPVQVYCLCCAQVLDGQWKNVKNHVKESNKKHQRNKSGDKRTNLQVNLTNEASKHAFIELSQTFQHFECSICQVSVKVRDTCSITSHITTAEHKAAEKGVKSVILHDMMERVKRFECFEIVHDKERYEHLYRCLACDICLEGRYESHLERHIQSTAHISNLVDENGVTVSQFHRRYVEASMAG